eukprot:474918_1
MTPLHSDTIHTKLNELDLQTLSEEEETYSQLNASDEAVYMTSKLLCAIGLTLAFVILFSLYLHRAKNKHESRGAFNFAVVSVICSIFAYMTAIFLGNDLLIHWKFDGEHQAFVSLSDSFFMIFYTLSKITFYCSFTYHVLKIFDTNSTTRKYLKVWMVIGCFLLFCGMTAFLIADTSQDKLGEIGVSSLHHIYVTMFAGHPGAIYAHYCAIFSAVIDMIYFIVLIYCYIKQLRRIAMNENREDNRPGVRGIVLLLMTCVFFWIVCVCTASGSSLAWLAPIDVISDDICLFLMFEAQIQTYQALCSSCDRCCFKCIYGSKGYGAISDVDVPGDDTHTEALL